MKDDSRAAVDVAVFEMPGTRAPRTPRKILDRMRADYVERKVAQICVELGCGAPLPDDHGANRCERCQERRNISSKIWRRTDKGLQKIRADKKRQYRDRVAAGLCTGCATPRAQWPVAVPPQVPTTARSTACPDCRKYRAKIGSEYRKRKRAGLVLSKTKRAKLRKKERTALKRELQRDRAELKQYKPLDEALAKPRVRILRQLELFGDWVAANDVLFALSVADGDYRDRTANDWGTRERNNYTQHLSRLARSPLVERREAPSLLSRTVTLVYDYRITEAGRSELARLLGRS